MVIACSSASDVAALSPCAAPATAASATVRPSAPTKLGAWPYAQPGHATSAPLRGLVGTQIGNGHGGRANIRPQSARFRHPSRNSPRTQLRTSARCIQVPRATANHGWATAPSRALPADGSAFHSHVAPGPCAHGVLPKPAETTRFLRRISSPDLFTRFVHQIRAESRPR